MTMLEREISQIRDDADALEVLSLAGSAAYVDRLDLLQLPLARVIQGARELDTPRELALALSASHPEAWFTGDWRRLRDLAEESLALSTQHGPKSSRWGGQLFLALLDGASGNVSSAQERVDDILRWALPRHVGLAAALSHYCSGFAKLSIGDFEAAYPCLLNVTRPGELRTHSPPALWVTLDLIESAVRTGRREEARQHVQICRAHGLDKLSTRQRLMITTADALVHEGRESIALFSEAIADPDAHRWPFELARCKLMFGEHLRRIRAPADARSALSDALDTFENLKARGMV